MSVIGTWKDEFYDRYGVLVGTKTGSNIWVEPSTRFVMGAITGQIDSTVWYHAFGTGQTAWDTAVPRPKPNVYQTALTNEVIRKPVASKTYMRIGSGIAKEGTLTEIYDPWRQNPFNNLYYGRFEPDNLFNGCEITITGGTNTGLTRTVLDYEQITGKITVSAAFPEACDETTEYSFTPSPASGPTNAIEFRTALEYTDLAGGIYLREQGLFAGTAAVAANLGYMVDCIHHERIWKGDDIRIVRFITLSFNP